MRLPSRNEVRPAAQQGGPKHRNPSRRLWLTWEECCFRWFCQEWGMSGPLPRFSI